MTHPNPRQSFLEATGQGVTLWLALEADESQYAWLIGDALQDYFGNVKELSGFIEDLLTKNQEDVLTRWKQKGLQTDFCVPSPEKDSKESEENPVEPIDNKISDETGATDTNSVEFGGETSMGSEVADDDSTLDESDTQVPTKTKDVTTQLVDRESEHETLTVKERPEVGNGDINSATKGSEDGTYTLSKTGSTSQSGGHWNGSHSGGGESNEHRELKEDLASNPSQLGKGLELVKIEYTFDSNDRVDILLRDGFGNPVTVEVETGFSFGNGRHVGVWQAVKYKHLAAVKYGLPCDQVRSILAAPEIPDDVKAKCKELGIEPIEVSHI